MITHRRVQKAKELTWSRYVSELEAQNSVLYKQPTDGRTQRSTALRLKIFITQHISIGTMASPHRLIANSAQRQPSVSPLKALSVADFEQRIKDVITIKTRLTVISLGDTECGFLGINRTTVVPHLDIRHEDTKTNHSNPCHFLDRSLNDPTAVARSPRTTREIKLVIEGH